MRRRGLTDVLKLPDFRRVWTAEIISDAGSFVTFIALAVYVHDLTGKTFAVGLALALRGVPWVVVGPVAGVFADRIDRRTVMITCDLARAALVALLPFTNAAWEAYAISFASGLFSPVFRPARQALLPTIAPGEYYVPALALSETAHQVLHTIGPALGGLAVLALGARHAFFLDAASFVLSALVVMRVTERSESLGRPRSLADLLADLREGARVLGRDKLLRVLVGARAFGLFALGDGAVALLLIYVTGLGRGSGSYGFALAAAGIGTASGTLLLGRRRPEGARRFVLVASAVSTGMFLMLLAGPSFGWLLVILAVQGLPQAGMTLYVSTFIAERVPDGARGRAFALTGAVYEIGEVAGALTFAAVGQRIGAARGLAVGGVVALVGVTAAIGGIFGLLRAADRRRAVLSSERAPVQDP